MNFVLVLDGRTPAGKLFIRGTHDNLTTDGDQTHPVLFLDNVRIDNPHYVEGERTLRHGSASHPQTVRIPHAAVVAMFRWKVEPEQPLGFLPAAKAAARAARAQT